MVKIRPKFDELNLKFPFDELKLVNENSIDELKTEKKNDLDEIWLYVDGEIQQINRASIKLFDEIKSTPKTTDQSALDLFERVYEELLLTAEEAFFRIAKKYYDDTDMAWLFDEILDFYDPVTKYNFLREVERKRSRHFEAYLASNDPKDTDKALRYWALMIRQYADMTAYKANLKKLKDLGVAYVKWLTEMDNRVCVVCEEREGKLYRIEDVPPKPHIGCRCWIIPS